VHCIGTFVRIFLTRDCDEVPTAASKQVSTTFQKFRKGVVLTVIENLTALTIPFAHDKKMHKV
jgi:hypothetical protein